MESPTAAAAVPAFVVAESRGIAQSAFPRESLAQLGHPSLAAFSVAFRRALGSSPMRYANRLPR